MTSRPTFIRPLFVLALTLLALIAAQPAAAGPEEEYIPFVTDFGGSTQGSEQEYVPFVTDFPHVGTPEVAPLPTAKPLPAQRGFDWADAGIGAGAALGLVGLTLGAGLAMRGRTRVAGA